MSEENVETMRAAMEAFNQRDGEGFGALLASDAEIVPVRAALEGTVYHGPDAAVQYCAAVDESWENLRWEVEEMPLDYLDPEVEWVEGPRYPNAQTYLGRAGVRRSIENGGTRGCPHLAGGGGSLAFFTDRLGARFRDLTCSRPSWVRVHAGRPSRRQRGSQSPAA